MTLLERDECGSEEPELAHAATPSIFAEACSNETYVEVGGGRTEPPKLGSCPRWVLRVRCCSWPSCWDVELGVRLGCADGRWWQRLGSL